MMEEMRHCNDIVWLRDMHNVWGPEKAIKGRMYYFNADQDPNRLWCQKKDPEHAALIERCWALKTRFWNDRWERLAAQREAAKKVLGRVRDGSFFEGDTDA
jgi:hypothetical protein